MEKWKVWKSGKKRIYGKCEKVEKNWAKFKKIRETFDELSQIEGL